MLITSREFAKSERTISVPPVQSESMDQEEIVVEQELENPANKPKENLHTLFCWPIRVTREGSEIRTSGREEQAGTCLLLVTNRKEGYSHSSQAGRLFCNPRDGLHEVSVRWASSASTLSVSPSM